MTAIIVPLLLTLTGIYALKKRVDVFSALTDGAKDGLKVCVGMVPALTALLTGIYMLRASGALDALAGFLTPAMRFIGIPPETLPLMLLRPFSGSGALAIGSELIERFGPDSMVGQCAAVMLGSTETTFYVIAVYFGAVKAKKSRRAIPAALAADITGFFMAALTARLFLR